MYSYRTLKKSNFFIWHKGGTLHTATKFVQWPPLYNHWYSEAECLAKPDLNQGFTDLKHIFCSSYYNKVKFVESIVHTLSMLDDFQSAIALGYKVNMDHYITEEIWTTGMYTTYSSTQYLNWDIHAAGDLFWIQTIPACYSKDANTMVCHFGRTIQLDT
jgi:hypothetical protein